MTHNLLNYLLFSLRIWDQPREQDSGPEMQVRQCLEIRDVNWYPIGIIVQDNVAITGTSHGSGGHCGEHWGRVTLTAGVVAADPKEALLNNSNMIILSKGNASLMEKLNVKCQ